MILILTSFKCTNSGPQRQKWWVTTIGAGQARETGHSKKIWSSCLEKSSGNQMWTH
jgi:hypothetical protein